MTNVVTALFFKGGNMQNDIRVKSTEIRVGVNDAGDYIVVRPEDATWVKRFMQFADQVKTAASNVQGNVDSVAQAAVAMSESFEAMFGEGSSEKVFGAQYPSSLQMVEFLEQITPIVQEAVDKRKAELDKKYNVNRTGATK